MKEWNRLSVRTNRDREREIGRERKENKIRER